MAINNVDIYGDEWLELVFANRNKSYGAYELRKHYSATVLKALGLTFGFFGAIALLSFMLLKPAPVVVQPVKQEVTTVWQPEVISSHEAPASHAHHSRHHAHKANGQSPRPVVAVKVQTPKTATPLPTVTPVQPIDAAKPDQVNVIADKPVYSPGAADVKPLPVGGAQGWFSYLKKNLVYPEAARHEKISGRVELSFIVEKDGSLSDIRVEQSAGHGFDEEAVRVLQQSPAWQPGMLNGEPIRIRYKLPINFRMMK